MTTDVTPAVDLDRDVGKADFSDWPERPMPPIAGERGEGYKVVFGRGVLEFIHRHGESSLEAEVGGVLLGNGYRDEHGPYLVIEAALVGAAAESRAAQVTFTADTWAKIQEAMEKKHPEKRMVGWYHTHPGFGIFLSGMDLFIQDHFFQSPVAGGVCLRPQEQRRRGIRLERGAEPADEVSCP